MGAFHASAAAKTAKTAPKNFVMLVLKATMSLERIAKSAQMAAQLATPKKFAQLVKKIKVSSLLMASARAAMETAILAPMEQLAQSVTASISSLTRQLSVVSAPQTASHATTARCAPLAWMATTSLSSASAT